MEFAPYLGCNGTSYVLNFAPRGNRKGFILAVCIGHATLTNPDTRGIFIGIDTTAAAGLEICSDIDPYIDFTNSNY